MNHRFIHCPVVCQVWHFFLLQHNVSWSFPFSIKYLISSWWLRGLDGTPKSIWSICLGPSVGMYGRRGISVFFYGNFSSPAGQIVFVFRLSFDWFFNSRDFWFFNSRDFDEVWESFWGDVT